jgi:spermidine/putrescine transport system substrate-binding protein
MNKIRRLCLLVALLITQPLTAHETSLNILSFPAYIPPKIITQFEREQHVKVNLSTINSNNDLIYAKLLGSAKVQYDIVTVSSYALQKFLRAKLIQPLDPEQLPHRHHLDQDMLQQCLNGQQLIALPFIWGTTGILINTQVPYARHIRAWRDFWKPNLRDRILLINGHQDVFNMLSFATHKNPNKRTPLQLRQQYHTLLQLIPNIRALADDNVSALFIDEDIAVGMAWSPDAYNAVSENPKLRYIYPQEGFAMWLDTLALTQSAPHATAAKQFLNFISRPDVAQKIIEIQHVSVANRTAWTRVNQPLQQDPILNPPKAMRRRGTFIKALNDKQKQQEIAYWQYFRLALGRAR